MYEFVDGSFNVSRHGEVYLSFLVAPIQSDSDIQFSRLISCDGIFLLGTNYHIQGISYVVKFYTKIIDYEGEYGVTSIMFVESRCGFRWYVTVCLLKVYLVFLGLLYPHVVSHIYPF